MIQQIVIIIKMSSKYSQYRKIHQLPTSNPQNTNKALLDLQQLDCMLLSIKNTPTVNPQQIPVSPRRWRKPLQNQQQYQKCNSVKFSQSAQTCDLTTNIDSQCSNWNNTNQKLPSTIRSIAHRRYQTQHYDKDDQELMLGQEIFSKTGFDGLDCVSSLSILQKEENYTTNKNIEVMKKFDSIKHKIGNKYIDQISAQRILQQLAQIQKIVNGL